MLQRIEAQHALHVNREGKPLRKTFHIKQWRRLIPQTLIDPDTKQPVTLDKGGWVEIARDALPKAPATLKDVKVPASLKKPAKAKGPKKKPAKLAPAEEPEPKEKEEIKFE